MTHDAVKGPGGKKNRQGKGIDPGVGGNAPACCPLFVGVVGHREKQTDIEEGNRGDDLERDHYLRFLVFWLENQLYPRR
jgi:hypothetical protein